MSFILNEIILTNLRVNLGFVHKQISELVYLTKIFLVLLQILYFNDFLLVI